MMSDHDFVIHHHNRVTGDHEKLIDIHDFVICGALVYGMSRTIGYGIDGGGLAGRLRLFTIS
jgi:hypothetical protein